MSKSTWKSLSRKGGEATKKKYGTKHYQSAGKKGVQKLKEKYGEDYLTKILPEKARQARLKKKNELASVNTT